MDKAALVSIDVDRGSEIVSSLDRSVLRISVALWIFLSEYDDWRLVLSSRQLDGLGTKDAYQLVNHSLAAAGLGAEKVPPILILPMSDLFIRELRRIFRKTRSVEGMRLGGQMIGGRFVEDAYVYRVS